MIVVGAGLENFGLDIEVKSETRQEAGALHGPQFHGVQKDAAVARRTDENGDGEAVTSAEQAWGDAGFLFLFRVKPPEEKTQLGAGHFFLKFGSQQARGQKAVLVEEDLLVEGHVGDADGALVAKRAVVAEDGDLEDGIAVRKQSAVSVVVTNSVGGGQVGDPAGFQKGQEPSLVLTGNGDGTGNGEGEGTTSRNGCVEKGVDPAQIRTAERRETVQKNVLDGFDFIDATGVYAATGCVRR